MKSSITMALLATILSNGVMASVDFKMTPRLVCKPMNPKEAKQLKQVVLYASDTNATVSLKVHVTDDSGKKMVKSYYKYREQSGSVEINNKNFYGLSILGIPDMDKARLNMNQSTYGSDTVTFMTFNSFDPYIKAFLGIKSLKHKLGCSSTIDQKKIKSFFIHYSDDSKSYEYTEK